jgi:hypothetical protein
MCSSLFGGHSQDCIRNPPCYCDGGDAPWRIRVDLGTNYFACCILRLPRCYALSFTSAFWRRFAGGLINGGGNFTQFIAYLFEIANVLNFGRPQINGECNSVAIGRVEITDESLGVE